MPWRRPAAERSNGGVKRRLTPFRAPPAGATRCRRSLKCRNAGLHVNSTALSFEFQRAKFSCPSVHRGEYGFAARTACWQRTYLHQFIANPNTCDGRPAIASGDPCHVVLAVF